MGSGGNSKGPQAGQTLCLEDKFRIASGEVEALQKDIEHTRRSSEQQLDVLRALLEETDLRISEVRRDAYEFRRTIVIGAENIRTGKITAEKLLKYLEDKLTAKDTLINKLLLKNNALKTSLKKKEKEEEDAGGKKKGSLDLHFIDYHQLQIENARFVTQIESENAQLMELKRTSNRTSLNLNSMKRRLAQLSSEAFFFRDEIKERQALLQKSEADLTKVGAEKESSRREGRRLRSRLKTGSSSAGTQILDFVNQKAEEQELRQQKSTLTKKAELSHVAWLKARSVAARDGGRMQVPSV